MRPEAAAIPSPVTRRSPGFFLPLRAEEAIWGRAGLHGQKQAENGRKEGEESRDGGRNPAEKARRERPGGTETENGQRDAESEAREKAKRRREDSGRNRHKKEGLCILTEAESLPGYAPRTPLTAGKTAICIVTTDYVVDIGSRLRDTRELAALDGVVLIVLGLRLELKVARNDLP